MVNTECDSPSKQTRSALANHNSIISTSHQRPT